MEYEDRQASGYSFAEDTLMDSYLMLARVNILTGEYEFLKKNSAVDKLCRESRDIFSFLRNQAAVGHVAEEYTDAYLQYADPRYLQKRFFSGGGREVVQNYRSEEKEDGEWISLEIVAPHDCGEDNPWAVFGWREADTDTTAMMDALSILSVIYYKILKIDLTEDSFECIQVEDQEKELFARRLSRISDWWKRFVDEGYIHEEDAAGYRDFTDLEKLRTHFRTDRTQISCRYRRKKGNAYRWAQMDLIPSVEYSDHHQVLLLYVKDIHEEYLIEQQKRQEMIDNYNRDPLTLLYNRHKYEDDLERMQEGGHTRLTCMYVDVNGLHELNNTLGHQKGDDMLCTVADTIRGCFPGESSYRIGGDEFVMLSTRLTKEDVEKVVTVMREKLMEDRYEVSVGVDSGVQELAVYKIVGNAEMAMRADKEAYYRKNKGRRQNRARNEELEQMIIDKQDQERFLQVIARKFSGVYFVDMKRDTLRYIYIPEYFRELLEKTDYCYSAAMRLYMAKYVKEKYQNTLSWVLDYSALTEKLRETGSLNFTYQKVDGTWVNLQIVRMEDKEKPETLWVFLDMNKEMFE